MSTSPEKRVSIGIMIALAALILTCIGIAISYASAANTKADNAIDRVSSVEGDIKGINSKLDLLTEYFKLTPKRNNE
ncbi:hypothetical protein M0R04_09965 [Candidatus Dojkabacteria bacterium]|jgi:hypothetical protein|nr:hypothetical protein [Candidatus Dojkabacteria bacterium]